MPSSSASKLGRRCLLGAALLPLVAHAESPPELRFETLYKSFGVRGLQFSDRVAALKGKPAIITGYMAPPLKAESHFFVLTSEPLALCPFCQSDADWPLDIVVIYLQRKMPLIDAGTRITVSGRLEVGSWMDPKTGFVSQLRLVNASFHRA